MYSSNQHLLSLVLPFLVLAPPFGQSTSLPLFSVSLVPPNNPRHIISGVLSGPLGPIAMIWDFAPGKHMAYAHTFVSLVEILRRLLSCSASVLTTSATLRRCGPTSSKLNTEELRNLHDVASQAGKPRMGDLNLISFERLSTKIKQ